ncbi:MAG: DUF362 domain-containing protein [Chloroflexi bacterium]|nr:DUF362 domain-containing protein [Chloroflexota bacterium]
MSNITRREFLRRLAAAGFGTLAGAWYLSACRRQEMPVPTMPPPTDIPLPPTAVARETAVPTATPSAEYPYLAVARGGEPEELVRRAITALGGMERFVRRGDDVVIKPNICVAYHTYEYAVTTNPWVVAALVRLCLEAGARRVRVMDYPFGGGPEEAYVRSGIQEQVLAAGGQIEIMAKFKFVKTDIPQGLDLRSWDIYDDILKADALINVPIAKDHSLARLALGMKNLMGTILNRPAMHTNLGQRLADLTSRIRPALTVVDAVRILVANGPTGGSLNDVRKLDTVIASTDIVATDSYAATLFGLQPDDLAYVRAGTAMGLGRSDLGNLKIEEIAVGG